MAAMTSKFNFECVIQYYADQWATSINGNMTPFPRHFQVFLSPFSTRRICSRDAKRKQKSGNVIG